MVKDHDPEVKNEKKYEALRDEGMSKEKAADVGISGRSSMTKHELIDALQNH